MSECPNAYPMQLANEKLQVQRVLRQAASVVQNEVGKVNLLAGLDNRSIESMKEQVRLTTRGFKAE